MRNTFNSSKAFQLSASGLFSAVPKADSKGRFPQDSRDRRNGIQDLMRRLPSASSRL
jgi:hypothetical protein